MFDQLHLPGHRFFTSTEMRNVPEYLAVAKHLHCDLIIDTVACDCRGERMPGSHMAIYAPLNLTWDAYEKGRDAVLHIERANPGTLCPGDVIDFPRCTVVDKAVWRPAFARNRGEWMIHVTDSGSNVHTCYKADMDIAIIRKENAEMNYKSGLDNNPWITDAKTMPANTRSIKIEDLKAAAEVVRQQIAVLSDEQDHLTQGSLVYRLTADEIARLQTLLIALSI